MTGSATASRLRQRGAAFWLSVVATTSLVLLYVGDVAEALGGGLTGFATSWTEDLLGFAVGGATVATLLSWLFWLASIALFVVLFARRKQPGATEIDIEEPAFARFLFHNSRAGLLWLPVRLFLAAAWLGSGLHKIVDGAWQDGSQLDAYWQAQVAEQSTLTDAWYRSFLGLLIDIDASPWLSWLIVLGEIAVGLGLLLGALTGIAAFFGATMNASLAVVGSASDNPVLFTLAVGVMLAWRVAGYYGLDRYLLPKLGTPWRTGSMPIPPAGG